MAAKRACEWNKFKEQMKAKRTKRESNTKVAPGMASILERKELTVQQLSATVSGKAQKYERVGARQFVSFHFDELTIENIKKACTSHFNPRTGMKCDVLSGERGPSCKSMNHIPDLKVIYVRFIEDDSSFSDPDGDCLVSQVIFSESGPKPQKAVSLSPVKKEQKRKQKVHVKSSPEPAQVYPKSLSIASMINMGKLIRQSKTTVVDILSFDMANMSWSALPTKVEFVIAEDHFAEGGFRKAYKATSQNQGFSDTTWVIKKYLPESVADITASGQDLEGHTKKVVQMHMLAKNIAEQLASQVKKEKLANFGECFNYKQIYLGWISAEKIYVTVEQFIPGQFVKYVNNTGNIIPALNDVNNTRSQKAECLVHFSYIKSRKKLMLVDIQGSNYNLYDPEIASTDLVVTKKFYSVWETYLQQL